MTSRLPGFYKKPPTERRDIVSTQSNIIDQSLLEASALSLENAEVMIENVVGTFALPIGVAVNFCINDHDRLFPMVVEEPSIVAAVSNMARLVRPHGGFKARSDKSIMIGQVQLLDLKSVEESVKQFATLIPTLFDLCKDIHPRLVERGGGIRKFEAKHVRYDEEGHAPILLSLPQMCNLQFTLELSN